MNSRILEQLPLPKSPKLETKEVGTVQSITLCKKYLDESHQILAKAFNERVSVRHLVKAQANTVDQILIEIWRQFSMSDKHCALIAVGGYGRAELHPGSDIDLLFLITPKAPKETLDSLQNLITFLWDIGLNIGHSVRTVKECTQKAIEDITIATNLIESRVIAGAEELFLQMREKTGPNKIWPARDFYEAKVAEQKARYRKYRGSSFELEPNLKGNPGGLRDIQLVGWIAKRYFETDTLHDLANQGIFTLREYRTLISSQLFLWRVRFALHTITGRGEDRLLFQHQKKVAEYLGFNDKEEILAVEQLMQKVYRAASKIRNVTELLLQVFEEVILDNNKKVKIEPIDDLFQLENDRVALKDPTLIPKHPELLLQTFIVAAQTPGNKHVSAKTLRAIRDNRHLIDSEYRQNKKYKQLFLEFFSIKHTGDRPLFLIKRNGVLARFLPLFQKISGQMQFDMFHIYSVDEHTLFLLKNLTRFASSEHEDEFPYCSKIMQALKKPQLIFLAGLFHDIAKGRGGDHSTLGAKDAYEFCHYLAMPEEEAQIVSWLVEYHLIMSVTAQRKDISDPEVIAYFANQVKTQERLDLLYILTVADIRATSPKLWNSWKDALLKELYLNTTDYLSKTTKNRLSEAEHISDIKNQALSHLIKKKVPESEIVALWNTLDDAYFRTTPVDRIVWQTRSIIIHAHGSGPLVEIKKHYNDAGTEIFIYTADQPGLFAAMTATLSQKNLRTQAAELYTNSQGKCFDSFVVLEESGKPIQSATRVQSIRKLLQKRLKNIDGMSKKVQRHVSSRVKHFDVPTEISFTETTNKGYTQMELTALDQPGLLAAIGDAIRYCNLSVHSARIVTLGEKVEDIFEISTLDDDPLNESQKSLLKAQLLKQIEQL
ncbi:[protein-PII] uridylyltransferase [Pleionea sediminis]|uniref:[protein-PII] uridylyltransferase n=1 Tax=Pleionea sediminis TaxID=2569479 RepID=UPI0011866046|nr:[protein-PII] uridylyltransferase [Pleionea sediminis]